MPGRNLVPGPRLAYAAPVSETPPSAPPRRRLKRPGPVITLAILGMVVVLLVVTGAFRERADDDLMTRVPEGTPMDAGPFTVRFTEVAAEELSTPQINPDGTITDVPDGWSVSVSGTIDSHETRNHRLTEGHFLGAEQGYNPVDWTIGASRSTRQLAPGLGPQPFSLRFTIPPGEPFDPTAPFPVGVQLRMQRDTDALYSSGETEWVPAPGLIRTVVTPRG